MFLRLKYMPAEMIILKKNIFSSKVRPQNNQYVVLNIRDICNIKTTSLTQVTYLCFIGKSEKKRNSPRSKNHLNDSAALHQCQVF